jgi:hypothetical protein
MPFMSKSSSFIPELTVFSKDTLTRGQPAKIECVEICGQVYSVSRGVVTVLSLEDDWYEDVADPREVVHLLKDGKNFRPDIFTFWQRLPDLEPKHPFHLEWDEIAVLPIKSYDDWWTRQIKSPLRNKIRKARKEGIVVRQAAYDDDFVRGMTAIFNETPMRQGRKFWHYGKDFQTIKRQFARNIHRESTIGAYYENEMIGFIMIGNAGRYGDITQIISSMKHRDKKTNNALIAGAVEVCEQKKYPYLVYASWTGDALSDFKHLCGFERTRVPRYFVPLTHKGRLALRLGIHRGWKELLPSQLKGSLKKLRSSLLGA